MTKLIEQRHRHDGWIARRQVDFLRALRQGATIKEACAEVGLSTTSAYRAKQRMPEFSAAWDLAIAMTAPQLERAVWKRAVEGWEEPVFQGGKQVGVRWRFAEGLLKSLWERAQELQRKRDASGPTIATADETDMAIIGKLAKIEARRKQEAEEKAAFFEERMKKTGWAP